MSCENQPLIGRMIALETRYEVSTQVLSSWPAERLPAMCGRATLATLVSRTSMNVARVTVSAMIHGLMTGRGRQAESIGIAAALKLFHFDFRFDGHAEAQVVIAVLPFIENDLHRDALDDFHVIAGGVFGRQQAGARAAGAGDAIHVAAVGTAIGVHFYFGGLVFAHVFQLRFFVVGGDPDFVEGHDGEKLLAGLDVHAYFGIFADHAIYRRDDFRVLKIELRLLDRGLFLLHGGVSGERASTRGSYLARAGLRVAIICIGVREAAARLSYLLLGRGGGSVG